MVSSIAGGHHMRLETSATGATVYFDDSWLVSFQKNADRQVYEYSGHGHFGSEEDSDMAKAKIRRAKNFLVANHLAVAA
jgi:hypothetical protein